MVWQPSDSAEQTGRQQRQTLNEPCYVHSRIFSDTHHFCGLHVKTQWACCCLLIALLLHFNISSLVRTWSILTYLLLHSTFYVCIWTFFIFLHVNSIKNIHWRRWLYKSLKPLNYCENVGWCYCNLSLYPGSGATTSLSPGKQHSTSHYTHSMRDHHW